MRPVRLGGPDLVSNLSLSVNEASVAFASGIPLPGDDAPGS